ncbi:RraA family protein [Paracoccus ravus]|uniref:RraA family protein n=1 Tax=Paracoccus ravus TaxID=2447760 RepID=UPI00106E8B12|nr:dimethylmenaquinone methyltransferase [Paracoccus ravus]
MSDLPQPAPIPAIDPALLGRWRRVPVAVLVDLAPECQIDIAIRPLRPAGLQPALFGRAVTARCDVPDFGAVLRAIALIEPGDVLMIDAGASAAWAVIGEILGGHLHRIGASGIVCDGAVRDSAALAGLADFPVYARHVNPLGPVGAQGKQVNQRVTIGGCQIAAGDLVLGDADGLAALSPARAAELIDLAEAKLALEAEWISRLGADEPIERVFGLR